MNDYIEIYEKLSAFDRENNQKEEDIVFALDWYFSITSEGLQMTVANFYSFIDEVTESLERLGASKNVLFINESVNKYQDEEEIKNVDEEIFNTDKQTTLLEEMTMVLDNKILELRGR